MTNTEATVTEQGPDARQSRKFAQNQLRHATDRLYGRSGMSKAEKVENLKAAAEATAKAYAALQHAIEVTEAEAEVEFEAVTPEVGKFADPDGEATEFKVGESDAADEAKATYVAKDGNDYN